MKKLLTILGLLLCASPAMAQTSITAKDAAGVTQTFKTFNCSSTICPLSVPSDVAGTALTGTAGAPSTSAITIQGIASGTAVPTSVIDGGSVALGAKADAAWVSGSGSAIALLKNIANGIAGSIPAGTNLIGKVGVDQTTPGTTNGVAIVGVNAATALAGTGAVGTGSLRVAVGTDTATIAGSAPGTAGTASTNVVTVQGVASMTKLLVTPDSVALPANQSVNIAQVNGVTTLTGTGAVGTGSARVAVGTDTATIAGSAPGTAGAASANVLTVQGVASMTKLLVTPDANSAINLAQVGGTTIVNGGLAGSQSVGGTVATNVAISANPLNLGAQAVSSENTAVTTARQVQLVADLVGKLITSPYANKENYVKGTTAAMTGTTSTQLIALVSSQKIYLTHVICTNSHATVGTFVTLQDGSGGATIYEGYAAAVGGGFSATLPVPISNTAGNGVYVADVTTGANVICSGSGYSGT